MIGVGIGIPFYKGSSAVTPPTLGETMAAAHYTRVTNDGGVLPAGQVALASLIDSIATVYGVTDEAGFNASVPVLLDAHYFGYKMGVGSGTTLGQAANKLYSLNSDASADVAQGTVGNQPLLLAHSGQNYWWGSGVAGNYCSTPNAAANQITGDIEIIIRNVKIKDVTTTAYMIGKDDLTNRYYVLVNDFSKFYFGMDFGAGLTYFPSAAHGIANNEEFYLKIQRVSSSGEISYYKSSNGSSWTLIGGAVVSGTSGAFTTGNSPVRIGGNTANYPSSIYMGRATISNSIGGQPQVDFNPQQYNAATSQTSWTASYDAGSGVQNREVWTINASTGQTLKGVLVDRTKVQFVRGSYTMATGTGTTFVTGDDVVYSEYVAAQASENQAQQSPANMKGTGNASIDFSASTPQMFYGVDNAGTIRRFDPSVTRTYLLSVYTIVGDTTTTGYVNNVAGSSDNTVQSTTTINQIRLGTSSNYNAFTGVINTVILVASADGSTPRTSMYNIIKTMNNL